MSMHARFFQTMANRQSSLLRAATAVLKSSQRLSHETIRFRPLSAVPFSPTILKFSNGNPFEIQKRHLSGGITTEPLESLGDSITTAILLSWNKQPGENVAEGDVIAVVETDKVTMDIRAKKSGVFVEGLAAAQSEVAVGAPLYKIDSNLLSSGANGQKPEKTPSSPVQSERVLDSKSVAQDVLVVVPAMGESITTGILSTWLIKEGERVKADQIVTQIETDKVNVEVRSPSDGILTKALASEGSEVSVGAPLFSVTPTTGPKSETSSNTVSQQSEVKTTITPSVQSVADRPVQKTSKEPKKEEKKEKDSETVGKSSSTHIGSRSETRVKMTRMRQRIASRLKESQNTSAMLTTFQEVDMSALIEMRNKYKDDFEKAHGVKLGFMSAFVKAAAAALQEIPAVNAVIDDATQEVVYRNYVDISVAVASPTGLVVPVLRNCETMNFADVEKTIVMFGKKAKDQTLAIEDMVGGTFTISNGGVFGSLFGTPIINPPQSAILGMHATKMRAVVVNGKVEARPMMYLALTYDHRLIDGREAVTFLKSIANKIEDPSRLLLLV